MLKKFLKQKNKIALFCLGLVICAMPLLGAYAAAYTPKEVTFDPNEDILRNSKLGENDPVAVVANIINWVLGILGLVALVLIIYGGARWMLSGGNEEQIKSAKDTIIGAIIGMAIILASYGISSYVFNTLVNVTN
ncbi:MAG: hypothetical protein WC752_00580 [Patescibacteria group bacterium]|jgi:hypothetical protein